MKALGFALALTWLAASLAAALPEGPPPGREHRPDELIAEYAEELGIEAATVEKIRALGEQHRAERDVIVAELRKQKRALRELLASDSPSEAEAIALARKIGTLETDLSVARLGAMMRVHALLTPEQNKALREKMHGRFAERRALFDEALGACETEIAAHCEEEGDGPPGHALRCLLHKQRTEELELSAQCAAALQQLPPASFHHFRRHHAGDREEGLDRPAAPPGVEGEDAN